MSSQHLHPGDEATLARHPKPVLDTPSLATEALPQVLFHNAAVFSVDKIERLHPVHYLIVAIAGYLTEPPVHIPEETILDDVEAGQGLLGNTPVLCLRFLKHLVCPFELRYVDNDADNTAGGTVRLVEGGLPDYDVVDMARRVGDHPVILEYPPFFHQFPVLACMDLRLPGGFDVEDGLPPYRLARNAVIFLEGPVALDEPSFRVFDEYGIRHGINKGLEEFHLFLQLLLDLNPFRYIPHENERGRLTLQGYHRNGRLEEHDLPLHIDYPELVSRGNVLARLAAWR